MYSDLAVYSHECELKQYCDKDSHENECTNEDKFAELCKTRWRSVRLLCEFRSDNISVFQTVTSEDQKLFAMKAMSCII